MLSPKKFPTKNAPLGCRHCPAPEKSVFEAPYRKGNEGKYVMETKDVNITRYFWKDNNPEDFPQKGRPLRGLKKPAVAIKNSTASLLFENSNPLGMRWSGTTFMTEYDDFLERVQYEANCRLALEGRRKWNIVKKKLRVIQFKQKVQNAGPDWFQDLSLYQKELTDSLPQMLYRDLEEGKTPRTQEFLTEVGVTPPLPAQAVLSCLRASEGHPIPFLFKAQLATAGLEAAHYEKSYWEAKGQKKKISPFSINERILLTCAFYTHFKKLLEKLDRVLPPAKEELKVLWGKKPSKKKKKWYSSPYLEPQPINELPWYQEQAEEELRKNVELQMRRQNAKKDKEEFQRKLAEQKKLADKEKEQKEKSRLELMKKKIKTEKVKVKSYFPTETEDVSDMSEMGDGRLPSRERKSEFFKNIPFSPSEFHQATSVIRDIREGSATASQISSEIHDNAAEEDDFLTEVLASNGCTQTPIRGIACDTLYAPYIKANGDLPKEGISEACIIKIKRSPEMNLMDKYTQTFFTNYFKPLKKEMRDFLLKQKAIEKQMEKFYLASMYKRGIFGPPTNNSCRTSCLLDLERMAINKEIKIIKKPSICRGEEESDEEYRQSGKLKVPNDMSKKELISVPRLSQKSKVEVNNGGGLGRRMSGPPIPAAGMRLLAAAAAAGGGSSTALQMPREVVGLRTQGTSEPSFTHLRAGLTASAPQPLPPEKKPITVECGDPGCELVPPGELPMDEFTIARKRIALLPIQKQLSAAVQYLNEKGDPLAVLPNISQVPWLLRWFEKRNGIKRPLTQKDKDELMERSNTFWNADYNHCTMAPLPKLPKQHYTWANKKWLTDHLAKILHEHQRRVKHILIDNARDLFPTMFCEYFNSPLNQSFGKVFYTYFPSCERDCLVNRPWDPYADADNKEANGSTDE